METWGRKGGFPRKNGGKWWFYPKKWWKMVVLPGKMVEHGGLTIKHVVKYGAVPFGQELEYECYSLGFHCWFISPTVSSTVGVY